MVKIANRDVGTDDALVMGAGALMLLDGFLPWYGIDAGPLGDYTAKGLSSGFLAWFPILLVVAVGAVVAGRVFAGQALPRVNGIGPAGILLAASGLAAVLVLLKLLTDSSFTRLGIYLGLVLAVGQAVVAYRVFRASGEALPAFGRGAQPPA